VEAAHGTGATGQAPVADAAPEGTVTESDGARSTTAESVTGHGAGPEAAGAATASFPATAASGSRAGKTEPAEAYGPDDPAYGPPGPRPDAGRAEPADAHTADGDADDDESAPAPRGPFEPLRPADRRVTDHDHDQDQDRDQDLGHGVDGDPAEADAPEPAGPVESAEPDVLDFGPPSDPEAGTLGRLRDLYLTAEALGRDRLDRHFDELLDRQRKLISDYLKEAEEAEEADPAETAESATPFGFDTAGSLAGLRGGLRSAP
jgi:hypothetical protein